MQSIQLFSPVFPVFATHRSSFTFKWRKHKLEIENYESGIQLLVRKQKTTVMKTRLCFKVLSKRSTLLQIQVDAVMPPSSPLLAGIDQNKDNIAESTPIS